jgi:tryptophan-rich sensory protein
MQRMQANTRLALCGVVIVLSALYGLLLEQDRRLAEAVAIGYIAIMLTLLLVVNIWKRS